MRVEKSALVVELRLSINLSAQTLEEVVAKMQRSMLQLISIISDDLRFAQVCAQCPWRSHLSMHGSQEGPQIEITTKMPAGAGLGCQGRRAFETRGGCGRPTRFQQRRFLLGRHQQGCPLAATQSQPSEQCHSDTTSHAQVLKTQRATLAKIAKLSAWEGETGDSASIGERMLSCAECCARAGDAPSAAALVALSLERAPPPPKKLAVWRTHLDAALKASATAGSVLPEATAVALQTMVARGAVQPWAPTLVHMAKTAGDGGVAALASLVQSQLQLSRLAIGAECIIIACCTALCVHCIHT